MSLYTYLYTYVIVIVIVYILRREAGCQPPTQNPKPCVSTWYQPGRAAAARTSLRAAAASDCKLAIHPCKLAIHQRRVASYPSASICPLLSPRVTSNRAAASDRRCRVSHLPRLAPLPPRAGSSTPPLRCHPPLCPSPKLAARSSLLPSPRSPPRSPSRRSPSASVATTSCSGGHHQHRSCRCQPPRTPRWHQGGTGQNTRCRHRRRCHYRHQPGVPPMVGSRSARQGASSHLHG